MQLPTFLVFYTHVLFVDIEPATYENELQEGDFDTASCVHQEN